MDTNTTSPHSGKEHAGFWLGKDLIKRIRTNAQKEGRSVDSYVEQILLEAEYNEPNETTLSAIKEVSERGKSLEKLPLGSFEEFEAWVQSL